MCPGPSLHGNGVFENEQPQNCDSIIHESQINQSNRPLDLLRTRCHSSQTKELQVSKRPLPQGTVTLPAIGQLLGNRGNPHKSRSIIPKTSRLQQCNQVLGTVCQSKLNKSPNLLLIRFYLSFEQSVEQGHMLLS